LGGRRPGADAHPPPGWPQASRDQPAHPRWSGGGSGHQLYRGRPPPGCWGAPGSGRARRGPRGGRGGGGGGGPGGGARRGAGVCARAVWKGVAPGTGGLPGGLRGHGALHLLFSSASFLSLIVVSTVVFARRFAALGQRGWALCAVAAGVLVLVAWAALVVTAASSSIVNIAFPAAVALTWALITVVAAQLRGRDY